MKVYIMELADRYIIVNDETGEEIEPDQVGFSCYWAAKEYADLKDWEIIP